MKKIIILLALAFGQTSSSMENVGYPIGLIYCYDKVNVYRKIGEKKESMPCKSIYGFGHDKYSLETRIFVYDKKFNQKDWSQVFTIKNEARWIPTGNESIDDDRFDDLDYSIKPGLYEISPNWNGKIFNNPNKKSFLKVKNIPYDVEVIESGSFDTKLWIKINLYDGSKCINEGEKPPKLIHSGWVPFMRTNTESNFEKPFECG